MPPTFGQLVIGPPGSGKTKYCTVMQDCMSRMGRKVCVVNLDPANENIEYECKLNIFELINVKDVMFNSDLGPNGSLMYCMEFLEANLDWLLENLAKLGHRKPGDDERTPYLLFDLPGQVELYTHHNSIKNIIKKLTNLDYRLTCVNLVDSYYASDPSKFISVLFMSLNTMIQIELPHMNILSKMDLYQKFGNASFNLDYYTEVLDLKYLIDTLDNDNLFKKHKKLNKKLCDVIEDYSLVSFYPLDIQSEESVTGCIQHADRANGFNLGSMDDANLLNSYAPMLD